MRTIIEVPDDVIASLDRAGRQRKQSRAAIIREAIAEFLQRESLSNADAAFGIWKSKQRDGVEYQNELRSEWSAR
jgi:predicted transcriptional regulator